MINKVVHCPHCGEESNGNKYESYLMCRECGMAYTEFGTDRRREGRLRVRKECTITHKNRESPLTATVENVSLNGAKMKYAGPAFIKDSILYLDVDDLDLHTPAKVVWTKSLNKDENSTGLRLIWPFKTVSTVTI